MQAGSFVFWGEMVRMRCLRVYLDVCNCDTILCVSLMKYPSVIRMKSLSSAVGCIRVSIQMQ